MRPPTKPMLIISVVLIVLSACGSSDEPSDVATQPTATVAAEEQPEPTPTEPAGEEPTPTVVTADEPEPAQTEDDAVAGEATRLAAAEQVIDAFYSYDPAALEQAVGDTRDTELILYYQGWAEGGNYGVLDRMPCEVASSSAVRCSITVEDDFAKALQLDFNVTDTFTFRFNDGDEITGVSTSSDDPALVGEAFQWANANRRDVLDVPCEGFFNGGPTPGDCARAFAVVFEEFLTQGAEPEG